MINSIIHIIKTATWKRVILLFCTSALLGISIVTMFFGQLKLNPDATMDSLSFYTSDTFYRNLDIQGDDGRKSYLLLHLVDYHFITAGD